VRFAGHANIRPTAGAGGDERADAGKLRSETVESLYTFRLSVKPRGRRALNVSMLVNFLFMA